VLKVTTAAAGSVVLLATAVASTVEVGLCKRWASWLGFEAYKTIECLLPAPWTMCGGNSHIQLLPRLVCFEKEGRIYQGVCMCIMRVWPVNGWCSLRWGVILARSCLLWMFRFEGKKYDLFRAKNITCSGHMIWRDALQH
jgi:hypothetical protein